MSDSEDVVSVLVCKICNNTCTDENSLKCDGLCKSVFHSDCVGIKKSVQKVVKSHASIKWLCQVCDTQLQSVVFAPILQVVENVLNQKFSDILSKI